MRPRAPTLILRCFLVFAVVVAGLAAVPAAADTQGQLDDSTQALADARANLEDAVGDWQRAEADLSRSLDQIAHAQSEIERLTEAFVASQQRFDQRAVELYMAGGSPTLAALFTSASISDVVDRWEFASSVAQGDQDLATEVAVQAELIRRERARLADAIALQADAAQRLEASKEAAADRVQVLADKVEELQDELDAQQAVGTGGGPIASSGAIRTCPVAGPNAFVDSFGDPRPGGRTHQGIDMIAPAGTPVVAVHDGTAHQTNSSLGGLGAVVYHDGAADWTFYTHFSAFGSTGHVTTGTVIGYVGETGDTNVNHLHFEYHPGGGAAVDPYSLLLAVC